MKVVITAQGPSLDSPVDTRFGRCAYFIVVDVDTLEFNAHPNPAQNASGGAGIQAAQFVVSLGVNAIITGSFGPNAQAALASTGLTGYSIQGGTVREAIELFREGKLSPIPLSPSGGVSSGNGFGGGFGRGGGMGRGGGFGRGGGMGRGGGRGNGFGRGGGFGKGGW